MTFPPVAVSGVRVLTTRAYTSVVTELKALPSIDGEHNSAYEGETAAQTLCVDVVGAGEIDNLLPRALDWARRGGLHLPVVIGAQHTSVGPLTNPGYAACIQCADYRGCLDSTTPLAVADEQAGAPDVSALTVKLISVTVAQEIDRVVRAENTLPMTLGGLIRIDHATGTVGTTRIGQVDGCEVCSSLLEFAFQGALG